MKKLILFLLITCTFSCASDGFGDGYDTLKCFNSVQKSFPHATVLAVPDKRYSFVVLDSCGAVFYVKTMGINSARVTNSTQIKSCK